MGKMYYEQLGYDFDPPFYASTSAPIVTNYDRLIRKTPEEMAELFTHLCCPYSLGGKIECNIENKGCKACWLGWLKQEAIVDANV